jgi:acetate---CoA ligase (ADP-forming)
MIYQSEIDLNQYYGKVVLLDGSTIIFRPLNKEDAAAWLEFYQRLAAKPETLRLQRVPSNLDIEDSRRYCTLDYLTQMAIVAEVREDRQKRIVAVGRYTRKPDPQAAEVFFNVLEEYQGKGIAAKLIEWLADAARNLGVTTFQAQVLPENKALLTVFQSYGFHMDQVLENGVYQIAFSIIKTPVVEQQKDERASQAVIKSLTSIFKPRSVAVVGASNRTGAMGQLIFQNLVQCGFKGRLYPINPKDDTVMSLKAYPSVIDVPDEIDLAIISVPSTQILNIVDECGRKKVKGLIVIADGFREKDEKGAIMEREMVDIAFSYGMRIIGPNCMGLINTDPQSSLKATFAWINPLPGSISFVSQSGALGQGVLEYANSLGIGFANFVSVGNRADIGSTDLLQYWEKDPSTKVILLYLESFDNPDQFSRISRRVSLQKPILAIKGGSTPEGSRASRSHTGAMATPGVVSDALLMEAGIVAVNSISELFDSAILLANQPVPRGSNVAIVSNGGGPGIMAADACVRNGLKLPEISAATLARLKTVVKREINLNNPCDLTAGVSAGEFEAVLKILAEDPQYDSILTIYISPSGEDIPNIEKAIGEATQAINLNNKAILSCFIGKTQSKGKVLGGRFVPYYVFPEEASVALANAVRYHELKTRQIGQLREFKDLEREKARRLINDILTESSQRPLWLPNQAVNELFRCYGIRAAETLSAETAEQAAVLAEKTSFPVVIKLRSTTLTHKTEVGGVVLNVKSAQEVRQAFSRIQDNLTKIGRDHEMQGVTVQPQIDEGLEVIVGVAKDPLLGHVMMFGMGGILADLMKDRALRLHPLTDVKALELIESVKIAQVLKGYRGRPPYDVAALQELLLRISAMVEDIPQITEMDLNPVKVQQSGWGYWAVDTRIMVQ